MFVLCLLFLLSSVNGFDAHFVPDHFVERNLTTCLHQQVDRFRAMVQTAIEQSVSNTVSICPPVDISDQAVLIVRNKLNELGWKVEWKTLAEHYSSGDPVHLELTWSRYVPNPCNGNRRAFRVQVPIKE